MEIIMENTMEIIMENTIVLEHGYRLHMGHRITSEDMDAIIDCTTDDRDGVALDDKIGFLNFALADGILTCTGRGLGDGPILSVGGCKIGSVSGCPYRSIYFADSFIRTVDSKVPLATITHRTITHKDEVQALRAEVKEARERYEEIRDRSENTIAVLGGTINMLRANAVDSMCERNKTVDELSDVVADLKAEVESLQISLCTERDVVADLQKENKSVKAEALELSDALRIVTEERDESLVEFEKLWKNYRNLQKENKSDLYY